MNYEGWYVERRNGRIWLVYEEYNRDPAYRKTAIPVNPEKALEALLEALNQGIMTQAEYDDPDYPVMAEYEDGRLRMVPYFEMPLTFENRGGCVWISMLDMSCPLSSADIEDISVSLERAKEGVFLEGFDDGPHRDRRAPVHVCDGIAPLHEHLHQKQKGSAPLRGA